MLRRISVLLVLVVLLALAVNVPAGAAPGEHDGRSDPGKPKDPNCWGDVTSQFASDTSDDDTLGEHASDQEEPRQGVGNVARTDPAPGDHPSDHGAFVGPIFGSHCEPGPETG